MLNPSPSRILISGVTGYIGGAILHELSKRKKESNYVVTAIVRSKDKAEKLEEANVETILFKGLDDLEACRKAASEHDVVINAASGSHDASANAWVLGLSDRQKTTGHNCYYIHTSGTSVVGYQPVLGAPVQTDIWSDIDDIHVYEHIYRETYKKRERRLPMLDIAQAERVKTSVVIPTAVWGKGRGLFTELSSLITTLTETSLREGHAIVVGEGNGIWNHVHISDLSSLYVKLVQHLLTTPFSMAHSVYWAENGSYRWKDASVAIAKAMKTRGLTKDENVVSVSLAEGAELLIDGDEKYAEAIYASSSIGKSIKARKELGWQPKHGDEEFWARFDVEVERAI